MTRSAKVLKFLYWTGQIVIIPLMLAVTPLAVMAHPPRSMELQYDQSAQTLHIEIKHVSSNLRKHRVRKLTIFKNGKEILSLTLPTQTSPAEVIKDIPVEAKLGDTLRVVAVSSEGGDIEETLIIEEKEKSSYRRRNSDMPYANRLIDQKSPYLLQHAHNPVDWYSWGEEAFKKAKDEDKPIFLSIGYSTCHWCHVMEGESFENSVIAKILNEHFVAIKVDREERPDIDQLYMLAVTAMTGQGGWPLSVFLDAQKRPFWGGTYFPPEAKWGAPGFKDILLSIANAWQNNRAKLLEGAETLVTILHENQKNEVAAARISEDIFLKAYAQLETNFDGRFGGFGTAPKFPMSHSLSFLLHYWKRHDEKKALSMVEETLSAMAKGGIYDYLGGGFHRYSTDQYWHVPHFEKMLYDQAILARTYLEAYQITQKKEYRETAREILDYVLRDMQAPEGGFFSAEDADSLSFEAGKETSEDLKEKKEGAFYVWGQEEILKELGKEEGEVFNYHFGVQPKGNVQSDPHGDFYGKNILYAAHSLVETAGRFKKSPDDVSAIIERGKEKLFAARQKRHRPHLDDKILVDWNGLMISSLSLGASVLHEPKYSDSAQKAAEFILANLLKKGDRLLHRFRDKEAAILGTLPDYAFFINGLMDLYEATFDVRYLKEAVRLGHQMLTLFWDEKKGGFFFTATDGEELILRQKEIYDGATPSGNSVAALVLSRLFHFTLDEAWRKKAEDLFKTFSSSLLHSPASYTQMLIAFDIFSGPCFEIVLSAPEADAISRQMIQAIYQQFIPNRVIVGRLDASLQKEEIEELVPFIKSQISLKGKPTVYICQNQTCKLPVTQIEKLKEILKSL